MKVAVLFSGGKDSTLAVEYALQKGYDIRYLLSVKPNRTDCYLFHFATVELTKELAKILNLNHIYLECDVADPKKEAELIKDIVKKNPVDAVIIGGIGLQKTQIKSVRDALRDLNVNLIVSHEGLDASTLIKNMINRGYEIMITQIASDGLKDWLGKKLDLNNFNDFEKQSKKYGFHISLDGGYADTLVLNAPVYNKKLKITDAEKIMESDYCGYLKINKIDLVEKSK